MAERILDIGRRWPITPVDMTSVVLGSEEDSEGVAGEVAPELLKQVSTV